MLFGYLLSTFKFIMIILNLSYFLAMIWRIYSELTEYAFLEYYRDREQYFWSQIRNEEVLKIFKLRTN